MTATTSLSAGDRVTTVVTKTLPFGALVEAVDGTPGLVTGLSGVAVGASVEVRVDGVRRRRPCRPAARRRRSASPG